MAVKGCEQTWSGNAYRRLYPAYRTSVQIAANAAASLIGYLGQALVLVCFGSLSLIRVTLLFAVWFDVRMASLQAYVGSAVESPAFRRASRCTADIFGFFHEPRPVPPGGVRKVSNLLIKGGVLVGPVDDGSRSVTLTSESDKT
jgi:hypothetical protein